MKGRDNRCCMDSYSQLDDQEILARAQDDPRAFAVLIQRHQAFVFGAAFRDSDIEVQAFRIQKLDDVRRRMKSRTE